MKFIFVENISEVLDVALGLRSVAPGTAVPESGSGIDSVAVA